MNTTWFEFIDFCVWIGVLGLGRPILNEIMVMSFLHRCFVPRSHKDTLQSEVTAPLNQQQPWHPLILKNNFGFSIPDIAFNNKFKDTSSIIQRQ